uniref:Zgc:110045 n=1 Tax=Gadus morhua TaxID=8049 RepID=A0A8C5C9W2_GADMO
MSDMEELQGPEAGPNVTLTLRLLMHGKVSPKHSKSGVLIGSLLFQSGARINISEGSSPERIVTITGPTEGLFRAFSMIAERFEEDITAAMTNSNVTSKPPVTLRLVIPGSQCGSLIGKGGSKIKEIRETTGAQVQVAGDMLPDSTERAVTISGAPQAITQCVRHICSVMLESPPKGATIPYRPKGLAGGHAVLSQQHGAPVSIPALSEHYSPISFLRAHNPQDLCQLEYQLDLTKLHQLAMQHIPLPSLGQSNPTFPGFDASAPTSSQELAIPNDFIGCIIGRQGSKINEIRQVSGAHIKIASTSDGSPMRQVTITGSPTSISVAQYLINASLEMAKYTMQAASSMAPMDLNMSFPQGAQVAVSSPSSMAMLGAPPSSALSVHSPSALAAMQGQHYALPVSSLLGMKSLPVLTMHPAAASSLAQSLSHYTAKMPKSERQKFAPY